MINALVFKEKEMILSCGTFSKNKPRIKKQVSLAYPKSSYANGDILDRNALADVIVAALKKEKMKGVELLMEFNILKSILLKFLFLMSREKLCRQLM